MYSNKNRHFSTQSISSDTGARRRRRQITRQSNYVSNTLPNPRNIRKNGKILKNNKKSVNSGTAQTGFESDFGILGLKERAVSTVRSGRHFSGKIKERIKPIRRSVKKEKHKIGRGDRDRDQTDQSIPHDHEINKTASRKANKSPSGCGIFGQMHFDRNELICNTLGLLCLIANNMVMILLMKFFPSIIEKA